MQTSGFSICQQAGKRMSHILAIVMVLPILSLATPVMADGELSVIRDISEQMVEPGSTFTVTLTVTANEEVIAPALDEDIPDGWTVTEVDSNDMIYKASTTEWILLDKMHAGESRTIIYNITVPDDAALQEYNITGKASAYDVDPIDVVGEGRVNVLLRGDFNNNGVIDAGDVAKLANLQLGNIPTTPDDLYHGDFNSNGVIDVGDVAKLANYQLGDIYEL